jgi:type I restriction enzyme S subunit
MINEMDLPDGWKSVTLGDVCNLVTDGTHEKTPLVSKEEGMPLVTSKDLVNNGICFDNVMYITKNQHNQIIKRSKPERGDILYSKIGTIGKPTIVDVNFEFSIKNVALFKLKKEMVCNKYVRYYLSSDLVHNRLVKTAGGGNQKFIPLSKLKQIEIILPPLQTQKKIVAILEKAERLKEWRKEADELTDKFLKSTFLEMFGDPMRNPKGWKKHKFKNIINEFRYGSSNKSTETGHPILRIPNVIGNMINLHDLKYSEVTPNEYEKLRLFEGDILFVRTNGNQNYVGRCAIVEKIHVNFIYASYLIRARINKEIILPEYLKNYLYTEYAKQIVKSRTRTSAGQYNINTVGLGLIDILVPPLELQQKFASIVQQVEQLREHQSQSKQHIDDLFNVLMQKAFKGELA